MRDGFLTEIVPVYGYPCVHVLMRVLKFVSIADLQLLSIASVPSDGQ